MNALNPELDIAVLAYSTLGLAIQNAQLFRDAGRRFDEMAALVEVAREISATLDPRIVLERMADRAQTLLEVGARQRSRMT